jgi:hypothetical protein
MKRTFGYVLLGLGAFLLVASPMLRFYAYPRLAKAPLDQSSTTVSEAPNSTFLDVSKLALRTGETLRATRNVRGDVKAGNDEVAVWNVFLRVEDSNGGLVTASTDRYAFDRRNQESVDCCGAHVNGDAAIKHQGIEYKFPFDTKKKSYPYMDLALGRATEMKFVETAKIAGLDVYKFEQRIEPTEIARVDVPGSLVGRPDPSVPAVRFYSNTRTVWVEPKTGVIVKGQEQQLSTLRDTSGTELLKVTEANLVFTDNTIEEQADNAKEARSKLAAIGTIGPLVSLLLGLLCIALGVVLVRREPGPAKHSPSDRETSAAAV